MKETQGAPDEPHTRRRWFHDEYFDLFVWQTVSGELVSFQLCYGVNASEQALVWNRVSAVLFTRLFSTVEVTGDSGGT